MVNTRNGQLAKARRKKAIAERLQRNAMIEQVEANTKELYKILDRNEEGDGREQQVSGAV